MELFAAYQEQGKEVNQSTNAHLGVIMMENVCDLVLNNKHLKRGKSLQKFLNEYCVDQERMAHSGIQSSRDFFTERGIFLPTSTSLVGLANFGYNKPTKKQHFFSRHQSSSSSNEEANRTKFALSVVALLDNIRKWAHSRQGSSLHLYVLVLMGRDYEHKGRASTVLKQANILSHVPMHKFMGCSTEGNTRCATVNSRQLVEIMTDSHPETVEHELRNSVPLWKINDETCQHLKDLQEELLSNHRRIVHDGSDGDCCFISRTEPMSPLEIRNWYLNQTGNSETGYKLHLDGELCSYLCKHGAAFRGKIKVNRADPDTAYIEIGKGHTDVILHSKRSIVIGGLTERNRAVHGDVVFAVIKREDAFDFSESHEQSLLRGEVIGIAERQGWREIVATPESHADSIDLHMQDRLTVVIPMSFRLPKIIIRVRNPDEIAGKRHVLVLDEWPVSSKYPRGHIVRTLGPVLEIDVELSALMWEENVYHHCLPFSHAALKCLPSIGQSGGATHDAWCVPAERYRQLRLCYKKGLSPYTNTAAAAFYRSLVGYFPGEKIWQTPRFEKGLTNKLLKDVIDDTEGERVDLRRTHLVCSVDPPGCCDIDDALSFRVLDNGNVEIGVHIADVSHFVDPSSSLDQEACSRGTTLYFPDRRFNMLPTLLSENICSLHAGVDRFAVSVLWQLRPTNEATCQYLRILSNIEGEINPSSEETSFEIAVDKNNVPLVWIGPSLICSTAALSYDEADKLIHGKSNVEKNRAKNGFPESLRTSLRGLFSVCRYFRRWRQERGSVSFGNSSETSFTMDESEGRPQVVEGDDEHSEIHDTIADLMILANSTVASYLCWKFPKNALLRRHLPPMEDRFKDLFGILENAGIDVSDIDVSNNRNLAQFLSNLRSNSINGQNIPQEAVNYVQSITVKAMTEAEYICSDSLDIALPNVDITNWLQDFLVSPSTSGFDESDYSSIGHYGLGLRRYTHFTSPIRRYADLIVHRLLRTAFALPFSCDSGGTSESTSAETFYMNYRDVAKLKSNPKQDDDVFDDLGVDSLLDSSDGKAVDKQSRVDTHKAEDGLSSNIEDENTVKDVDVEDQQNHTKDDERTDDEQKEVETSDGESDEDSMLDDLLDLDLAETGKPHKPAKNVCPLAANRKDDENLNEEYTGDVDDHAEQAAIATEYADEYRFAVNQVPPGNPLYSPKGVQLISEQANKRHREAKVASRECNELYLALHFANRIELVHGVIGEIQSQRLKVFIPKYQIEGTIFLTDSSGNVTLPNNLLEESSSDATPMEIIRTLNFNVDNLEETSRKAVMSLAEHGLLRSAIKSAAIEHIDESKLHIKRDGKILKTFRPLDEVAILMTCDFHAARVRRPPLRYELTGLEALKSFDTFNRRDEGGEATHVNTNAQYDSESAVSVKTGQSESNQKLQPTYSRPIVRLESTPSKWEDPVTPSFLSPGKLNEQAKHSKLRRSLRVLPESSCDETDTDDIQLRNQNSTPKKVSTGTGKPLRVLVYSRGRFYFKGHAAMEYGLVS